MEARDLSDRLDTVGFETAAVGHGAFSRRAFLRATISGAAAGVIGLPLVLAACGSVAPAAPASSAVGSPAASAGSGSASAAAGASHGVKLPAYVPLQTAKADLPSPTEGIDPGYLGYPKKLFKAVPETPGKGGTVTAMTWLTTAPPAAADQNPAWQAVNKGLGVTMQVTAVPFASYNTRFATMMAGGDIPDLFLIPLVVGAGGVPGLPEFLKTACTDLTPYLSGDAVKAYPNIANFPTLPWKTAIYNNAIYAVPLPIAPIGYDEWLNQTRLDAIGAKHPTTAAELKKLLQDLTNPNKGQWGTTAFSGTAYGAGGLMYMGMFGGPNVWRLESDGKFTKDLETPAAKEAAAYVRDLVAAGVFDPGTNTYNILTAGDAFGSGKAALFGAGWPGYQRFWDQGLAAKPPMAVRSLLPFGADGGKGVYMLGVSNFGVIAMKKASESRVKELLSIINYLASPFGSEESLLLDYGVQRTDHNLDAKGNPVLTNKGKSDVAVPWSFIGRRPPVLYDPTSPDFAKVAQQDEQGMLPAGIQDPTLGLYSPTWVKKGPVINKAFVDGLNLIVSGQQPISQYDQLVKDWQSGGGNQIKQEYAQALAATK